MSQGQARLGWQHPSALGYRFTSSGWEPGPAPQHANNVLATAPGGGTAVWNTTRSRIRGGTKLGFRCCRHSACLEAMKPSHQKQDISRVQLVRTPRLQEAERSARKPPGGCRLHYVHAGSSLLLRSTCRDSSQDENLPAQSARSPAAKILPCQRGVAPSWAQTEGRPLGTRLHQHRQVCINHRAIIRGKISSGYWQHLSLIPALISTRGRIYKQQWWKRRGEKKSKWYRGKEKKKKAKITKALVKLEETNYIILQGPRDPYHGQIRFSFNMLGFLFLFLTA